LKKAKETNYFHEIRAKKFHSKIDQQQKGPQQSGRVKKTCFLQAGPGFLGWGCCRCTGRKSEPLTQQ